MDTRSGLETSAMFAHGGEMAERMRVYEWTHTSLGPVEGWPQSLQTAVSICLISPLPSFILWGETGAALYNDPARTILGAKHPAVLGAPGSEVWPELWHELQPTLESARSSGVSSRIQQHVSLERDGDSQARAFDFSCSPIFDDAGVAGVFVTVTEAMSPEEVRPTATGADTGGALLETIFEAITDAVFIYDRNGKIVRMNAAARDLFDLDNLPRYADSTPEERAQLVSACDDAGNLVPSDKSGLARLLCGETLTGANALDVRLRLPTGRELEVNITEAPLIDETGAITGAVAISRDVTSHRQLEREAAERASLLEAVFQAAPDSITIFDESGTIVQLNAAGREIAGPDRQRARLGEVSQLYDLRTADGRPLATEELPLVRSLRGETVSGVELQLRDADGRDH